METRGNKIGGQKEEKLKKEKCTWGQIRANQVCLVAHYLSRLKYLNKSDGLDAFCTDIHGPEESLKTWVIAA